MWVGAAINYKSPFATFHFDILKDVLDESGGLKASLGVSEKYQISDNLFLQPSIELNWVNDDYVDYYYGVKATEVRADRAFYRGESTINYSASLNLIYNINAHHQMMLGASYTAFGSGIKDSSIVDSTSESNVGVYYLYKF